MLVLALCSFFWIPHYVRNDGTLLVSAWWWLFWIKLPNVLNQRKVAGNSCKLSINLINYFDTILLQYQILPNRTVWCFLDAFLFDCNIHTVTVFHFNLEKKNLTLYQIFYLVL